VMALVIIVGAFVLAGVALATDWPGDTIPAWLVALVGGVGIFYYKNGDK
jgi:hypothetical protein